MKTCPCGVRPDPGIKPEGGCNCQDWTKAEVDARRAWMHGQRQDDLTAQMRDVMRMAVEAGCYDAHDWIVRRWDEKAAIKAALDRAGSDTADRAFRPTQ